MSAREAAAPKAVIVRKTIADIKTSYFVRTRLNEDRVLFFAAMYESGEEVEPIEVEAETDELVDGRHRKAALELIERKLIDVKIVQKYDNPIDLLMDAFTSNLGGALPPTSKDVIFLMRQFLESGLKHKDIAAQFAPYYPSSLIKRYLADAYSAYKKARMQKALHAVAEQQLPVDAAAERFKVDLDELKTEISGTKRKKRRGGLPEIKSQLSKSGRGYSNKAQGIMRMVFDRYDDGECTEQHVEEVFVQMQKFISASEKNLKNWRERFAARKQARKE